jgi:hypothetical protein
MKIHRLDHIHHTLARRTEWSLNCLSTANGLLFSDPARRHRGATSRSQIENDRAVRKHCPLSGVKRTSRFQSVMSAFDPKRTLAN